MPTIKKKQVSRIVHAQVKSPVLIRKTILEASILSIENLKLLKNIRQIKKRKDKLKTELRRLIKEMDENINGFEAVIPTLAEAGISVERETEKDIGRTRREEERKRRSQERLLAKTEEKEDPFQAKDEFDFDIEKLKDKINRL